MKKEKKKNNKQSEKIKKLAVIRIRGSIKASKSVKDTFNHLNLFKKNSCIVLDKTNTNLGLIKKIKDYVTWGEIDNETYELLIKKRGELFKGRLKDRKGKIEYKKYIEFKNKKYKKYIRLHPPKSGFEKKGIKLGYKRGGALGYRGEDIENLIKRMI
jgi:large subunit ribosomal protein L30